MSALSGLPRGLDPDDWAQTRALGHRMLDDMLDWVATAGERPVWRHMPEALRAELRAPIPLHGQDLGEIYEDFRRLILPYSSANEHPRMMGWVNGGGNAAGYLAELLGGIFNVNCAGRDHAAIEVERQVIAWAASLVGMPADSSGVLVTGSSMANMIAVLTARRAALGAELRSEGLQGAPLTAYASEAAHGCIARALDMAGLGTGALRLVPADSAHRMDLEALRHLIAADRAAGRQPFLAVGTAGTVDTGAIDDLAGIAAIAAGEGLWFHVDGAFGATIAASPALRPLLHGIERADSLAFDFHKWAQVPYDAGCVLVRDPAAQRDTFAQSLSYLTQEARGLAGNPPWPRDLGPDLSRGFRALKVWMTLKAYGTEGIARVVERGCAVARHLEARILREPSLELLAPVSLNIVCFRVVLHELPLDALNRDIVADLQEAGIAAPSTTTIGGKLAIRAALFNHRTAPEDADALVDGVLAMAGRKAKPGGLGEIAWSPPALPVYLRKPEGARSLKPTLLAVPLACLALGASAQPQPQPLAQPPALPQPQDVAWPGEIRLSVDATDVDRHIVTVHETIPVGEKGGDLILLYPRFIPGDHGPTGPVADLASLTMEADGKRVAWLRDVVNINAFHVAVPEGADRLDVSFQYLSPPTEREGRVEMTPEMIDLAWNSVVLYPAGVFTRGITVRPEVKLPAGWQFATALATDHAQDGTASFQPVTLNTLVDSPLYAGRYFARIDLDPGAKIPVHLNIVADRPEDLVMTADQLAKHRALVQQAGRTFGSHHYDHYDFLLALSDQLGGVGLEHHRSSENGVGRPYFSDWDKKAADRDLLPHEYTHSWDGKFRRPADLWAPDFSVPERDSLLWVYEGQTQFWGQVLAARSGLWSREQALDAIALDAAQMDSEIGRSWRPLQDTTNDPIINQRRPQSWRSWERSEDYYTEGLLIWLDADTLIRTQTQGRKSLNDFARLFFGIDDGSFVTVPYQFEDVVKALNEVMPYDWAGFLRTRLDRTGSGAPLDGLSRGGYRLVYTDKASPFLKSMEGRRKAHDFTWSIGLSMGEGGTVSAVQWDGPAYRAGLVKSGKIIAVNGLAYDDADDLESAIRLAQTAKTPIELLVRDGNHFRTLRIDYHGGLRYPHLERIAGAPAVLDDILKAL